MNKIIINLAKREFKRLLGTYRYFNVVFVDNWRGFRFVFDTDEIKKYPGKKFYKSELYKILKNEKQGYFSADLYPASQEEKKFFGPQIFLNCKTFSQYADCFANFISKISDNRGLVLKELDLLKNLTVLYCGLKNPEKTAAKFRRLVIKRAVLKVPTKTKKAIQTYVGKYKESFL